MHWFFRHSDENINIYGKSTVEFGGSGGGGSWLGWIEGKHDSSPATTGPPTMVGHPAKTNAGGQNHNPVQSRFSKAGKCYFFV